MQLRIDAVTKAPRVYQGKTQWGVKTAEGKWYSLYQNDKPARGDEIEVRLEETTGNDGRTYWNAYPIVKKEPEPTKPAPAQETQAKEHTNGKALLTWTEYNEALRLAHEIARELESEDGTARAAIIETIMAGVRSGAVTLPEVPF